MARFFLKTASRCHMARLFCRGRGINEIRRVWHCLGLAGWLAVTSGAVAELQRTASGDLVIRGVPMVDQGDRAYCIAASLERVLRYHGVEADQEELARLSRTDAQRGIFLQKVLPPLRPFLGSRGVKLKVLYGWTPESFVSLMQRYNAAARRAGAREVPLGLKTLHVPTCLGAVDRGVFREVRLRETGAYRRFLSDIAEEIAASRPLLWAVQLDLSPVEEPTTGGHMRLIVGFNPATEEVLYSDSWGRGHEAKRMRVEQAWVMTSGLLKLVRPQSAD